MFRDPEFKRFDVFPLTGTLGAEVRGADLVDDHDGSTLAEIRRVLEKHLAIAVRDQKLTAQSLHDVARRFGPYSGNPVHVPEPGLEDVVRFVREPTDSDAVIGDHWHMDLAWLAKPPGMVMLYGEEVPPVGGDTCFVSLIHAYDRLSPGLRAMLQRMTGVHCGKGIYGTNAKSTRLGLTGKQAEIDAIETEHPVLCVQPNTGRRYLLVNSVIRRFKDMTEEESKPLIDYLLSCAIRPESMCRIRWEPGTLTMWANPLVMHTAIDDYRGYRRVTYRTTVEGWTQIPAPAEALSNSASAAA
jgi:taurine dioxygenase